MTNQAYPFADVSLARRLENAEAHGNILFIEARARAFPDSGAKWMEVAGAHAMFDGIDSPVTQTFGLGISQPITPTDLGTIEHFFRHRGAQVFHEVSPLADPSTFGLLTERGYQPIEFTNVLFRPISSDLRLSVAPNKKVDVHLRTPEEEAVWSETALQGWSEFAELIDFLRDMGRVHAKSESLGFLATLDSKPVATGMMSLHGGVGLLAGASTIPEARRQGAQLALLEYRLRYAAEQGCDIAMIGTLPGSASQRNAERHGFRIAYTRIKWQLVSH
ncbi:MAG TPA: GNAT family N-acetyltransferase [Pyrinomonadaceae bacterium]|jgi:GNAT superfamily N-acetyltransferase